MTIRRRAILWLCASSVLLAANAGGQTIFLKDGKSVTAKSLRRQGDVIMATQEMSSAPGKAAATGEVGYPVAQIRKIDFPEPAQLRAATELLTQGRAGEALTQLDVALRYYEGFRDAPGSWWADLALLKTTTLINLGREKDAEPLVDQIARMASDPETVRAARVQVAAALSRRGDPARALELCDSVIKESLKTETLAAAAVTKGQCHLALKQWEAALLAFLQIPVFHPDARLLQPPSLLGAGQAFFGIEDYKRARASFEELIKTFGATPEAATARTELARLAKLEKALAPVK